MSDAAQTPPSPPEEPKMEIHKPKPVHNWRELLTELAIVVLGVGIALGAEQTVEWFHWRARVVEARNAIGNELGLVMGRAIERVRFENCLEQRLDALSAILDEASRKGALPPVPQIGGPPNRPWPDDVWQTAVASDTATHFPMEQLNQLGNVYAQIRLLAEDNRDEQLAWANLSTMIGPGRRLDPSSDAALRAALSQARYYNRIMTLAGGQVAKRIDALGLPYGPVAKTFLDTTLHRNLGDIAACRPLGGHASIEYGQAQLGQTLNTFRDWQKYPPYVAGPAAK